ncbi:MAG: diacylglycerol kinase family protein [Bacteroidia bacterium]
MKQKHGIFKSFYFALKGIRFALNERNFRIHLVAALLSIILGILLNINTTEWLFVFICIGAVLSLEILNTIVESILDKLHPDVHPEIGRIKDLSAGAVLIAAITSIAIAFFIFVPKILIKLS